MPYANAILAETSLASYWRMNETVGSTLIDAKGTNHGTYNGNYALNRSGPTSYAGTSVYFDGSSAYGAVLSSPSLHPTGPFTIEAWFNASRWPALHQPSGIAGCCNGSDSSPRADYEIFVGGPQPPFSGFDTGTWYHVMMTWDGSTRRVYVNGLPSTIDLAVLLSTPGQNSGRPFFIAYMDFGSITPAAYEYFNGYISNVALYSAALSADHALDHYNAAFVPPPSPHAVVASVAAVFTPSASQVPTLLARGQAQATQVVAEVVRGQIDGLALLTQVCVEVVRPYVAGSTNTFAASASASAVFTATARGAVGKSGSATASAVFHATANGFHGIHGAASASAVFSATAVLTNLAKSVRAAVTVVFRARAKNRFLPVVFGDDYLGRFQEGQEVPLWVLVRDAHGRPTLPTVSPPVAEVYDLDTRAHVESVEMTRTRGSRVDSVYGLALRLGPHYPAGRYGVVYRAPTGGFIGFTLAIFEVVAGGDPSGPALATHTFPAAGGDQVMAHLGSGAVAKGSRPRVP